MISVCYQEEEMEEDKKEEDVAASDDKDRRDNETDVQYWQRVLGPAYHDHVVQTLHEQEELAKTLGKGKRIRKQINYAEQEMMAAAAEPKVLTLFSYFLLDQLLFIVLW